MVYSGNGSLPAHAITFNHRSEAMYRAIAREPGNDYVKKGLSTGLEGVRMLQSCTPKEIRSLLCNIHNNYHEGTGETWLSIVDQASDIMRDWEERTSGPQGTGLTTQRSVRHFP